MMERGDVLVNVPLNRLLGWLDRQAAITEAEQRKQWDNKIVYGPLTAEQARECLQDVYYEGYGDGFVNRGAHINEIDWQAVANKVIVELKDDPYDIVSCEHVISSDTLHLILDE